MNHVRKATKENVLNQFCKGKRIEQVFLKREKRAELQSNQVFEAWGNGLGRARCTRCRVRMRKRVLSTAPAIWDASPHT